MPEAQPLNNPDLRKVQEIQRILNSMTYEDLRRSGKILKDFLPAEQVTPKIVINPNDLFSDKFGKIGARYMQVHGRRARGIIDIYRWLKLNKESVIKLENFRLDRSAIDPEKKAGIITSTLKMLGLN